jgi:sec-independent protein translocase protein TatC
MASPSAAIDDPEEYFAHTRMSFGDHIEELSVRLWRAIKGLVFFMCIGFALDGVGYMLDRPNIGVGRPMVALLTQPVEDMARDYYYRQASINTPKLPGIKRLAGAQLEAIDAKLKASDYHLSSLTSEERELLLGKAEPMPMMITRVMLEKVAGPLPPGADEFEVQVLVYPAYQSYLATKGETLLELRKYIKTLSVQEPFLIYMKVSLLCGLVLGAPFIFYQIWAFVAAGLYPHERKYVHVYMPFSIGLFMVGAIMCQFLVVPNAVQSLLALNSFLGTDPDIRLDEWLSFALLLPLIFGLSFQTPLVMLFLNRIGLFTYQDYLNYWRGAAFFLMLGAVLILPTPDLLSIMYLYVPMFLLYLLGIGLCKWFPREEAVDTADEASQVAV